MPVNLFSLSLQLSGYPLPAAKKYLHKVPETGDSHLKIAQFHLKNNPFYAHFTGFTTLPDWEALPILKKANLQIPLEQRLSRGFNLKNVYVGKTSGSSGQPFSYAKDKFCHALSWASFYNNYKQYNINLSQDLQARFYGIPLAGKSHYKERFKDLVSSRYRFPIFDLSEAAMENFLNRFKKRRFSYINGYTSSIFRFAEFLKKKNIVLNNYCPSLKLAIVTSEMLFESDRSLMEASFGVPVVNEYGASETGLIAFENPQKQLIIDEKLLYVEILDEQNRVLPYGEKGRIVITSLYNKAQPFIRYEIGDLGSLEKDPSSGKLFVKELSGRTGDFARLPSVKTVPGLAFYYVTKKAMQSTAGITEFVVKQDKKDRFIVQYVSKKSLENQEKNTLKKLMVSYLEAGITINFERLKQLKRSPSGKLKQFSVMINE